MIEMQATMNQSTMMTEQTSSVRTKRDWALIVGGVALAIAGLAVIAWPGISLTSIALLAGAFFMIAGVAEIVGYFAAQNAIARSGWQIVGGIANILIGIVMFMNPVVTAALFPLIAGVAVGAYGIVSIVSAIAYRATYSGVWGLQVANGVIAILCSVLFLSLPAAFPVFLGVFMIMRGITMSVFGAINPSDEYAMEEEELRELL